MQELRADARRARVARRERVSSTPARVTLPLLSAVVLIGAAAAVTSAAGLSSAVVLTLTLLVAVAGAVVARRTVKTVLAGLTLHVVRPYGAGERLRLYAPEFDTHIDAEIVRVGIANTTLATPGGLLVVPNTRLLHGSPQQPDADLTL
jgi:small-conductance mechanosensitive channel